MTSKLQSEYIINEELTPEKMKKSINSELMFTSVILSKIQKAIGIILERDKAVQLGNFTVARSRRRIGNHCPSKYSANLNTHICYILEELWNNALDACTEKNHSLWIGGQNSKINLKVQYNEKAGTILIRIRDNGIGSNSKLSNGKKYSSLDLIGGVEIFELYLQDFDFVIQHDKVLTKKGAVIPKVRNEVQFFERGEKIY